MSNFSLFYVFNNNLTMTCRRAKTFRKTCALNFSFLFAQLVIKAQTCLGKSRNSFKRKFIELNKHGLRDECVNYTFSTAPRETRFSGDFSIARKLFLFLKFFKAEPSLMWIHVNGVCFHLERFSLLVRGFIIYRALVKLGF